MAEKYDFRGWATRADTPCSDGRTIKDYTFKDQNGTRVPLVWNHNHENPEYVLGHADLEYRKGGMYCHGAFNNTELAQKVKEQVKNGDINSLSIWANKLRETSNRSGGRDVQHGIIREVSLVLAGANPGAYIEEVMAHSDDDTFEAFIFNDSETLEYLEHSDKDEEEKNVPTNEELEKNETGDKTVKEVIDTMTEEQKKVLYYLVGAAAEDAKGAKEEDEVKHNAFENTSSANEALLIHSHMEAIEQETLANAKSFGSMKEAYEDAYMRHSEELGGEMGLAHSATQTLGETAGLLFPDFTEVNSQPDMIEEDNSWVAKVMSGVHKTPFSKVKATYGKLDLEKSKAAGYIKGDEKKVNVLLSWLNRKIEPTTIYTKADLDRDDTIDIKSFSVIEFMKGEMRKIQNHDVAQAILIGDGREVGTDGKIDENKIIPILTDNEMYTINYTVKKGRDWDYKNNEQSISLNDSEMKGVIRAAKKSRKQYKGSGNPTFFTTEDLLTDLLLIEDQNGRVIYDTEEKLRTALRVKDIVTVHDMERLDGVYGIIVNLADYTCGADKGGEQTLFDQFDIDFNQMKYLLECRISGGLTKPKSAIVLRKEVATEKE